MSYVPKLKYVFISPRAYDLRVQLATYRYLNSVGITPYILAGENDVFSILQNENITFVQGHSLPANYDIMVSAGCGYVPFERYWLEKSMAAGRINIQANSTPILYIEKCVWCIPKRTRFIHARDISNKRTALNHYSYNKEVIYLNTGRAEWDYFQTNDFKKGVADLKNKYGNKLLVIGANYEQPEKEDIFYKWVIDYAESKDFKVILQLHPRKVRYYGNKFSRYLNPGINHYVLFAAASHFIGFIQSSTMIQNLLLGSKSGCMSLMAHYPPKNCHVWIDDTQLWRQLASQKYGKEVVDVVPLIHDLHSLEKFLSPDQRPVTQQELDKIFGWPRVPNYNSYFFEIVEGLFGTDNEKKAAVISNKDAVIGAENLNEVLNKDKKYLSQTIDVSFWEEKNGPSELAPAAELTYHVKTGVSDLKSGSYGNALLHLNRAIMFSGTDLFAFVQYARAACYLFTGQIDEAKKSIYQCLLAEPNIKEYQKLQHQINAQKTQTVMSNY